MFIVFSACLIGAPATCSEEHVRVPDYITTSTACWVGAPPIIIAWEREHPDRKAAMDYRCVPENRLERRS